ncbi:SiaB family protein kinase [Vibrio sp. Of7-15]|uniref:SiaB family protein kinase n=1 Tax=Vibrio sp. Of7-15 TaxID=2724879 RepID=UPI001EF2B1E4|nr:SiaB family protein kinase [Vibrio sp. Of7-15]MCG7495379.1 SiaB family protein kinase [Vibrio sp. Of7-15]
MDIRKIQNIVENEGIIFLTYGGFLSQTLISSMTEALEKEAEHNELRMGIANDIFTIFIELAQNIMHYGKSSDEGKIPKRAEGLIVVGKDSEDNYYIHSQNIISKNDVELMTPILSEIKSLGRVDIKKRYREIRKNNKRGEHKGAGFGFYEIAKRCTSIDYEFTPYSDDMFYFQFKTLVNSKKEK